LLSGERNKAAAREFEATSVGMADPVFKVARSFFYLMVLDKCRWFLLMGDNSLAAIEMPLGAL
jgi:hypothetical protein